MGVYVTRLRLQFGNLKLSYLIRTLVYLNVPICCMGALVLALSLNGIELAASEGASWEDFLHKFDFVGL
jgi:hypothetical protein